MLFLTKEIPIIFATLKLFEKGKMKKTGTSVVKKLFTIKSNTEIISSECAEQTIE